MAFVKKLMKPRFTPCNSLNLSLYFVRISITGCMFTSLKVVSMAVVFFASTNRRLTVLRRLLIFSVFSFLLNNSRPGLLPGLVNASSTSSFKILPPIPEGEIFVGFIFLSAMMAEATGVALISGCWFR